MGWAKARSRCPIRLVVVAGVEDLLDNSKVLLSLRRALHQLGRPQALIRRRGEELTQKGLIRRVCAELRGSCRILRVQRRHHLRVTASCVDDRIQIGICGRDPGPSGQRQCQTANRDSQSAQRQFDHVWTPAPHCTDSNRPTQTVCRDSPTPAELSPSDQPEHGQCRGSAAGQRSRGGNRSFTTGGCRGSAAPMPASGGLAC